MTALQGSRTVRLDRAGILDAAERIVGSEGLPALTMRRIGSELGADPTAVYRHFRNKEALLTCLADRMFGTEPELDSAMAWQGRLRALVRHHFERYRAHPDLGTLLARQPDTLPSLIRIREQSLRILIEGGLTLEQAALMSHVLENHVVGCGLFFAVSEHHREPRVSDADAVRRVYAMQPAHELPLVSAAAPFLFGDTDQVFDHTTELLIAAIELTGGASAKEDSA
jgi:AcrR family transcriptional regulator